jgi:hypothetical protein
LQPGGKIPPGSIAVLPFQQMISEDASAKAARCPLCGSILRTEKFPPGAEKIVEDIFLGRLKNRGKLSLIEPDRTGAFFDRISAESLKKPLPEILKKVGSELQAESIIIGYVYRFKERTGYAYSAEKPASVAFDIHLVRVNDGTVIWKGIFDETQKSLMENMFQIGSFFQGGGQWLTAKELATEGIDALMENFPVSE